MVLSNHQQPELLMHIVKHGAGNMEQGQGDQLKSHHDSVADLENNNKGD